MRQLSRKMFMPRKNDKFASAIKKQPVKRTRSRACRLIHRRE